MGQPLEPAVGVITGNTSHGRPDGQVRQRKSSYAALGQQGHGQALYFNACKSLPGRRTIIISRQPYPTHPFANRVCDAIYVGEAVIVSRSVRR